MALKDIKIVAVSSMPCQTEKFNINGIRAHKYDFGSQPDVGSFDYEYGESDDENWSCADNQFVPREDVDPEVLSKYGITEEEYREIQVKLKTQFAVGRCSWCV